MRKIFPHIVLALSMLSAGCTLYAQKPKYNYAAQQKILPAELGAVYIGMDLRSFLQKIKLDSAEIDDRFEPLQFYNSPFQKGNIESIAVKFMGITEEQKRALSKMVTVTKKSDFGDSYETEVKRLDPSGVVAAGQLYEIYIRFKKEFDAGKYLLGKYGKPGDVHKENDPYHFYDMQWTKKTTDGLLWLIRYNKPDGLLLAGRVPGSEWDASPGL